MPLVSRCGCLLAALLLPFSHLSAAQPPEQPTRLKRSESFFGVHFDFHARLIDRGIGRHTTPAMIEQLIDKVRPDYIQIDSKGHFGVASYPTSFGNAAPEIVGDPLRMWRDVTAQKGVALYLHYSGVVDEEAIRQNPGWSAIDASGKPIPRTTSVFSPYVDRLMIPQLRELAEVYRADGAWVDGDCWGAAPDYSEPALAAFRAATGIAAIPRGPGEPHWPEFIAFHREAFRSYLRRYIAALRKSHPDFQVTSNWAFSDHMPEPISVDLPFLSGDYAPQNSVNSARFTARVFENQGRPWDLMAWGFTWIGGTAGEPRPPGNHPKSVVQLQQEAAVVLARGEAFQLYFSQQADGSIYDWHVPIMAELARFCRDRQALSHRAVAVPQVALFHSTESHYRQSPHVFRPRSATTTATRGVLQNLLDCQQSVQVVSEHHIRGRMSDWPMIVLPETEHLSPALRDEFMNYVREGGKLLLIGPSAAAHFKNELGVLEFTPPRAGLEVHLAHLDRSTPMLTDAAVVSLSESTHTFGRLYLHDNRRENPDLGRGRYSPAASLRASGRGFIAATYVNLGERYLNARTALARDFMGDLVQTLQPSPLVNVAGSRYVDVSVMRQQDKLCIHLSNTSGPHENPKQYAFDEIPALGPLTVTVRLEAAPSRVWLAPGDRTPVTTFKDGMLTIVVPNLEIHDIVVIER